MKPYKEKKTLLTIVLLEVLVFIVSLRLSASIHLFNTSEFFGFFLSIPDFIGDVLFHPISFSGLRWLPTAIIWFGISFIIFIMYSGNLTKKWNYQGFMKEREMRDKSIIIKSNPKKDKMGATSLDEMIGLGRVKEEVEKIINYYKVQRQRKVRGMQFSPLNLNLVFYGNPGTGKTVVARYLATTLKKHRILSRGQMIEADRATMVSPYAGRTAKQVHDVVEAALGGILFIDEAYTLTRNGDQQGQEAVDTLLKLMEDYKEDLVVIVAGYDDLMNDFVASNPGLASRFTKHLKFPDYDAEDLTKIFELTAKKRGYHITSDAHNAIKMIFEGAVSNKGANFANGRFVRNLFEQITEHQALRIGANKSMFASKSTLMEITHDDVNSFVTQINEDFEEKDNTAFEDNAEFEKELLEETEEVNKSAVPTTQEPVKELSTNSSAIEEQPKQAVNNNNAMPEPPDWPSRHESDEGAAD